MQQGIVQEISWALPEASRHKEITNFAMEKEEFLT
jgi:hypothetical protein